MIILFTSYKCSAYSNNNNSRLNYQSVPLHKESWHTWVISLVLREWQLIQVRLLKSRICLLLHLSKRLVASYGSLGTIESLYKILEPSASHYHPLEEGHCVPLDNCTRSLLPSIEDYLDHSSCSSTARPPQTLYH